MNAIEQMLSPTIALKLPIKKKAGGGFEEKEFQLGIDFNVLAMAEQQAGIGTNLLIGIAALNASSASAVLWAALVEAGEQYSIRDVRRMIMPQNLEYILQKLVEAYRLGMPEAKEADADPTPPPATA